MITETYRSHTITTHSYANGGCCAEVADATGATVYKGRKIDSCAKGGGYAYAPQECHLAARDKARAWVDAQLKAR